jgi:hypothetical protein
MKFPLSFLRDSVSSVLVIKGLLLMVIIFLWTTHSFSAETNETDCGLPGCEVKYRYKNEANSGCEAINRALRFFKHNGYQINTPIHIRFLKKVTTNDGKMKISSLQEKQVMALYDGNENCIKITSLMTDYCRKRKALDVLPFDMEFYTSLVTHEVAHRLYDAILKSRGESANHSFSEFIAYVTQIATMKEPNKSKVLSLWPNEILPSVFAINSFVWMADPNKFCVMSYRFFKSQPEVIRQILNGKIKPVESGFILDY